MEIHYLAAVKIPKRLEGEAGGIDAGLSEVFPKDHGMWYRKGFSEMLSWLTCIHKKRGENRGGLHEIQRDTKYLFKARRIRRKKLGGEYHRKRLRKITGGNQTAAEHKPELIYCFAKALSVLIRAPLLLGSCAEQEACSIHHPDSDRVASEPNRIAGASGRFPSREGQPGL
ncbi:hypothetical protein A7K73_07455 [Candidatus Methylacidiphilum fumarolicum]|uniref:hypothetical protein n=1 Tax=Candidatus Methylacidiphilum fumarolicum TaxID=591154 RepID=UPI0005D3BE26|nr:hypothetical protein [Candidatus Methylacidiphilum fumarolicum]MBW6415349.1 hypothetical protein [Candidatus Methylacidiphilum fumarolicum]TFE68678.1 hypothetical protein A7K73_07455 [Candidatus Methylacidiphilum fumarolicum]TFE77501.1 hypothetical protein A7D33_04410 [Candidatus Methylacidiphilum fumarolicum]